jgi:hypothetical protein
MPYADWLLPVWIKPSCPLWKVILPTRKFILPALENDVYKQIFVMETKSYYAIP